MKPICVPCCRFYRPKKTGYFFTEGMPADGERRPKPGKAEPEKWQPYKIWSGDLWECPDCKVAIVVGVGLMPVAERHHDDFPKTRINLSADLFQVNDC